MTFDYHAAPGFQAEVESEESQIFWSGVREQDQVATQRVTVDDESLDAGNTPTSTIRAGQVMAIHRASGNAYVYDKDATDGRQVPFGVMPKHLNLLEDGSAVEKPMVNHAIRGLVKAGDMVGDFDLHARKALTGVTFDDADSLGAAALNPGQFLMYPRGRYVHTTSYTVLTKDDGHLLMANGAGAVTFTLPTIAHGLQFWFLSIADQNMIVTGAAGLMFGLNTAAGQTATFSTSSEKIGASVLITAQYVNTTLKWVSTVLAGTCTYS